MLPENGGKNSPAAPKFAGKPFKQGISDSHSLLAFGRLRWQGSPSVEPLELLEEMGETFKARISLATRRKTQNARQRRSGKRTLESGRDRRCEDRASFSWLVALP